MLAEVAGDSRANNFVKFDNRLCRTVTSVPCGPQTKERTRYIAWAKTSESMPILAKGVRHVCGGTIDFCA